MGCFQLPPAIVNYAGGTRHVGVEVEFAGIDVADASEIVVGLYGGAIEPINRFGVRVLGARFGDFRVEIDSTPLKEGRFVAPLERFGVGDDLRNRVEAALETIARKWIPSEIVTPPWPIDRLGELELLRAALHANGALGTRASLLYTFGFQLNPELPSADVDTFLAYTQSFLLLYDWLLDVEDIDFTRRLFPFIDPFPEEYRALVLDRSYAPDLERFVDDYLFFNPTRNRPLDLLPALAFVRPEQVLSSIAQPGSVNPRPAFHYRLPNCLVDDPSWSFAVEWNRWVEVERLAFDPVRRRTIADGFLRSHRGDRASRPSFGA